MSGTKAKENKIVALVLKHVNAICVLCYFIGIVWFLALSLRDLSATTYQSENALLPGLQHPHFGWNEGKEAEELNRILSISAHGEDPSNLQDELIELTRQFGMHMHQQKFSSKSSLPDIIDGKLAHKIVNGTNLYGIIRAGRASSTESIVLNVPLSKDKFNHALGIVLALGRQIREQTYWAKDVILLFSDMGYIGVQAWLQSYYNTQSSEFIKSSPLEERAGAILASLVLEFPESVSYFNADVVGNNGQLPNLDLFNVFMKLSKIEGIRVAVHDVLTNTRFNPMTMNGYLESLRTTVKMMSKQAKGFSYANHAMFLQYDIQSLLVQGRYENRDVGKVSVGRVTEGIIRSMNNLLEKFHQSFFFYLLSSTDRFISIGLYMPPFGLLILAPTLKALCIWIALRRKDAEEENEAEKMNLTEESIEELLDLIESPMEKDASNPWIKLSYIIALTYLLSIGLYFSPRFAVTWSAMFELSTRSSLLLIFISTYVIGLTLPFTNLINFSMNCEDCVLLRVISLVIHACTIGCIGVMNFSFGMVLAVATVPLVTLIQSKSGKLKVLHMLLALMASPVSIALILSSANQVFSGEQIELMETSETILRNLYEQSLLGNNWIFPFSTLLLYPNWLLFWYLSSARKEIEQEI